MTAEGLLWIAALSPLAIFTAIAVHQAAARRRARLPMWRALATFARRHDLSLRECLSAPYGVPEAHGEIGGRPFDFRVAPGKSAVPVRTVVALGHRVPFHWNVYITRGNVSRWVIGSPRWEEAFLGAGMKDRQVRITSPRATTVARLRDRLRPEDVDAIRRSVNADGFYAASVEHTKVEVHLSFLLEDALAPDRTVADALALADAVESCFAPEEMLADPGRVLPWRTWPARATDSVLMVVLMVLAGFLAVLPLAGSPDVAGVVLLEGLAAILFAMAGSRLWASWLGPEERRILAEFAAA